MAGRGNTTDTVRWRGGTARVGPIVGRPNVARVTVTAAQRPTVRALEQVLARLRAAGYRLVVTSALGPSESEPFERAGFQVRQLLHLLAHDLREMPDVDRPLRRARRLDPLLALDTAAFDPDWRFGPCDLTDARRATRSARIRVAGAPGAPIGYALAGRCTPIGYLQRLAVHPQYQRNGWGRALVADALRWLARRGTTIAYVNTQAGNDAALALYGACGFRPLSTGLCTLERGL